MKRYLELDGLRGIAAFAVFVTHAFGLIWNTPIQIPLITPIINSPISILWNGSAAVDFFFVLSGFVLALPFLAHNKKINYLDFIKRRFLRIYPTYWGAMFLAVIMRMFYKSGSLLGLSDWINSYWNHAIPIKQVIKQIFFHIILIMPGIETPLLNPVIWTLSVEMKVSFVLPIFFLLLGFSYNLNLLNIIVSILCFLGSIIFSWRFNYFEYLPLFVMGVLVAKHKDFFLSYVMKFSKFVVLKYLLLLLALYLYTSRYSLMYFDQYQQHFISAFGSCLIIIIAISYTQISKILTCSIIRSSGKISYSFYLIHLPIMIYFSSLIYPATKSLIFCWLTSLVLSIILAYCLNRIIETPSQKLAKKLSI